MNAAASIMISCSVCGSDHVSRDAWADWDAKQQEWVLGAVFDQGFCHRCEEEQRLIEHPLGEDVRLAVGEG